MRLAMLFLALGLMFLPGTVSAKEWRGIVPLKSTRTEVEKRLGKPDKWGGYDLKDERASFDYGGGPCKGLYLTLGQDNCKCLANENAVMSIFVEPTTKRKASDLRLDTKNYRKTAINPFPHTFSYENTSEGIVYTVDTIEDEIKHITYYPSVADCNDLIAAQAHRRRNAWRGLVPLHSNRRDVESMLRLQKVGQETFVTYETDYETIVAKYSKGKCDASDSDWNVTDGTLIELVVNPNPNFLLKELRLDFSRYERLEIRAYPEIDNPPKDWNYIDKANGIRIRTQSSNGGEELVVSIAYYPSQRDDRLRCR